MPFNYFLRFYLLLISKSIFLFIIIILNSLNFAKTIVNLIIIHQNSADLMAIIVVIIVIFQRSIILKFNFQKIASANYLYLHIILFEIY